MASGSVYASGDFRFDYTAHCVRVGSLTALVKLGLSEVQAKAWIGWSQTSNAWDRYARFPVFTAPELVFLRSFFAQALPAGT